jgi:hypothetical protein
MAATAEASARAKTAVAAAADAQNKRDRPVKDSVVECMGVCRFDQARADTLHPAAGRDWTSLSRFIFAMKFSRRMRANRIHA